MKKIYTVMLISLLGCTFLGNAEVLAFNDVTSDHWAYSEVTAMSQSGILQGFEDNTFRPNETMTREQYAKFFSTAYNLQWNTDESIVFTDIKADRWSYNYIHASKGYIGWYSNDGGQSKQFGCEGDIFRSDVAKSIVKIKNLDSEQPNYAVFDNYLDKDKLMKSENKKYIALAIENGIMVGDRGWFRPTDSLSRGEASVLLYRQGILNMNTTVDTSTNNGTNTQTNDNANLLKVVSVYPAEGEAINANTSSIKVTFSKEYEGGSIYPEIKDENGKNVICGEMGLITKEYNVALEPNHTYTIDFTNTNVEAGPYVFTFKTTSEAVIERAVVQKTTPSDYKTGVSYDTNKITITYSSPVTIQNDTWIMMFAHIEDENGNSIRFTGQDNGNEIILNLNESLKRNTTYTVNMPTMLMKTKLTNFSHSYSFKFTTN